MSTDEQLMLEFKQGSKEAFLELFARYREPIYRFFRRRLDDMARAEELAQETFLAVLRGIKRYEPRAMVKTYLYGIATNLLLAELRKQSRENPNHATKGDPPQKENLECVLWVRQAIGRLGGDEREVLMLREYEQLSYAEIAALQRVPVNTVRSRLFRARMALRDLLAEKRNQGEALK
jgi:RNA polymerase sigma-70 factor, ECF subfamily